MPLSHIILPLPSPVESKTLFYTSVSLLLSHIQGYRYHLLNSYICISILYWCFYFWLTSLCITGSSFTQLIQFSSVQSLSHVQLFATPWTAAPKASLSITTSWSLLKLMCIESVMPSKHLILCLSLSCSQSFSVLSFPTNQLFTSSGQSIGA